jgi:hypothetical protein
VKSAVILVVAVLLSASTSAAVTERLITSKDIKNGTIQPVDLSAAAKRGMRGSQGQQGAQGPQGLPGPPGAQGAPGAPGASATALWAVINGLDGTLARGSGVTTSGTIGVGEYVVDFNRNVSGCAYVASLGAVDTYGGQGYGGITVARRPLDPNGVYIRTDDNNGTAFRSFHLAVFC